MDLPAQLADKGFSTGLRFGLAGSTLLAKTRGMDVDSYELLASLMWFLRPADVTGLARFADELVDRRIAVLRERTPDGC